MRSVDTITDALEGQVVGGMPLSRSEAARLAYVSARALDIHRGTCQGCDKEYALRHDGTMRLHDDDDETGRPCLGCGRPPRDPE